MKKAHYLSFLACALFSEFFFVGLVYAGPHNPIALRMNTDRFTVDGNSDIGCMSPNALLNIEDRIKDLMEVAYAEGGSQGTPGSQGVSNQQIGKVLSFYDHQDFPHGLSDEIASKRFLSNTEITEAGLKEMFPDKCDQVITQVAVAVRESVTPTLLHGANDVATACPHWKSLDNDDRKDFYVALVTAMALAESSCNNSSKNKAATNGTAYGLWQSTKPQTPIQGAKWVMKQLDKQVGKSGLLFWSNSHLNYWAVMNPDIHAHKVTKVLKQIPGCVAKAAVSAYFNGKAKSINTLKK
jgi:hypothetical protein